MYRYASAIIEDGQWAIVEAGDVPDASKVHSYAQNFQYFVRLQINRKEGLKGMVVGGYEG